MLPFRCVLFALFALGAACHSSSRPDVPRRGAIESASPAPDLRVEVDASIDVPLAPRFFPTREAAIAFVAPGGAHIVSTLEKRPRRSPSSYGLSARVILSAVADTLSV